MRYDSLQSEKHFTFRSFGLVTLPHSFRRYASVLQRPSTRLQGVPCPISIMLGALHTSSRALTSEAVVGKDYDTPIPHGFPYQVNCQSLPLPQSRLAISKPCTILTCYKAAALPRSTSCILLQFWQDQQYPQQLCPQWVEMSSRGHNNFSNISWCRQIKQLSHALMKCYLESTFFSQVEHQCLQD